MSKYDNINFKKLKITGLFYNNYHDGNCYDPYNIESKIEKYEKIYEINDNLINNYNIYFESNEFTTMEFPYEEYKVISGECPKCKKI